MNVLGRNWCNEWIVRVGTMNGYKENNVGNVLMKLNLVKNVLFGLYADHRMRMHPFMVVAVRQAVNSI